MFKNMDLPNNDDNGIGKDAAEEDMESVLTANEARIEKSEARYHEKDEKSAQEHE